MLQSEQLPETVPLLSSDSPGSRVPQNLPWYKTPSPWWLLSTVAIAAMLISTTIAPQTELQISLACAELKPEYSTAFSGSGLLNSGYSGPSPECKADPDVQAAVAALSTVMTTTYGILSCLTTGWWGKLSDKHGRTRILGLLALGGLLSNLIYILVTHAYNRLPGGYRFLIVSSISEGIFGGMAAGAAASHAYISDCSDETTRSRWFSLYYGLLFAGVAFGPTLGAVLVETTDNILSVFYFGAGGYFAYIIFLAFIVPESLSIDARKAISERRDKAREERRASREAPSLTWGYLAQLASRSLIFLAPLAIFLPRQTNEPGKKGKDWNLTFVAIAFAIFTSLQGSYGYKFQYAIGILGWDSVQLGIWLTGIGIGRALNLCVIVPLVTKYLKGAQPAIALPTDSEEPLASDSENPNPTLSTSKHPAHYDLVLARMSVLNEFFCYMILLLSVGSKSWVLGTQLSSLSTGFAPLIQSLALSLVPGGENMAGALFGGLSVLQALSSAIVGPFVFGTVYVFTVATFPKTIFAVGGSITLVTFALLCALRLPRGKPISEAAGEDVPDGTE